MMAPVHPRLLLVALQLLTRLPVGDPWRGERDAADGIGWFAVVGVLVGGVAASAFWATSLAFRPLAAAVISVVVTVVLTGALHEDGLADSADGFFGGRDPDERLRIMRDSTLGTYGVLAVVLAVLLRVSLLAALDPVEGAAALVASGAVSRGVLGVTLLGTVPASSGSGAGVIDHLRALPAGVALASATAVAVGLLWLPGAAMVAAALATTMSVRAVAVRRIGGLTGDVMGAMVVLADLAALLVVVGVGAVSVQA